MERKFKEQRWPSHLSISYEFVEDYLWNLTLGQLSAEVEGFYDTPHFIDQPLYLSNDETKLLDVAGVGRMGSILKKKGAEENPIVAIFGEGGVGKSTFCKRLANNLSNEEDMKAIYLTNESYEWPAPDRSIKTVKDLYYYYALPHS